MSDSTSISVVIPVGPQPHHADYLPECLESVKAQTLPPSEVILIDDMHGLPEGLDHTNDYPIRTRRAAWRLGVAHAFNFGVALAENDLVFMLGADDRLLPTCLEQCVRSYEKQGDGYHYVGVEYSDERPNQYVPCGAAMVTKTLWRETGGFPTQSAVGASDAALISIMMRHMPEKLLCVNKRTPLYWYRSHDESETARSGPWQGVILTTRDLVTSQWAKPSWGRYA